MDYRVGSADISRLGPLFRMALQLALLCVAAGCAQLEDQPPTKAERKAAARRAKLAQQAEKTPSRPAEGATQETWEAYFLQGARAGYAHTTRRPAKHGRHDVVEIEVTNDLTIRRFGEVSHQHVAVSSVETTAGRLLELRSETKVGPQSIVVTARVDGDRLVVVSGDGAGRPAHAHPWSNDVGGLTAIEDSLTAKPMQPGERRSIRLVMPLLNDVLIVENRLRALDYEATPLLHGEYELLRIESQVVMPGGQTIDSLLWTDRAGETLKTSMTALGMDTYRTTKEVALEEATTALFDLGFETIVKLARPLVRPHHTSEVRYRVRLKHADPAAVFVTGATQQIRSLDAHTAEVIVRALTVDDTRPPFEQGSKAPTEADRAPNDFVQSDDRQVQRLAHEATGDEQDPTRIALALERFVHERIEQKNFGQAFATAAEVAKSLEGDCTEHAVLLAALARARGIPARVAVGLVYIESQQGFGYHMWNELYLNGRWVPLDATLGRGRVGGAHLKLADSNLAEGGAVSSFLPVVNVIGQLEIEILQVAYARSP